MADARPIGIFDSGVGGLTVLRAVRDRLPAESTIYLGDLAFFPYGPKLREVVEARALNICRRLVDLDVKAVVVACNTATSAALPLLRSTFELPLVGVVEPGATKALEVSRSGTIGVVATEGTVRSGAYEAALRAGRPSVSVHQVACGRLVDLVEAGQSHGEVTREVVQRVVHCLRNGPGCDTIILGCTHYPLVLAEFEAAAGEDVAIVDSASATAETLADLLHANGLRAAAAPPAADSRFLVTAHADTFITQARRLFGEQVRAEMVELESTRWGPRLVTLAGRGQD